MSGDGGTTGHVFIATSLDGFIARRDGGIDWLLDRDDPAEDHGYPAFIATMDAMIMGRGSFEVALGFDPWPYDLPVLVLSRSLPPTRVPPSLAGRLRIADLAPQAAMHRLQAEGHRRIYVDGGRIVQSFLRGGLIADMVVTVAPVLLGQGRRLFGETGRDIALTLLGARSFPSGLVQSSYRLDA